MGADAVTLAHATPAISGCAPATQARRAQTSLDTECRTLSTVKVADVCTSSYTRIKKDGAMYKKDHLPCPWGTFVTAHFTLTSLTDKQRSRGLATTRRARSSRPRHRAIPSGQPATHHRDTAITDHHRDVRHTKQRPTTARSHMDKPHFTAAPRQPDPPAVRSLLSEEAFWNSARAPPWSMPPSRGACRGPSQRRMMRALPGKRRALAWRVSWDRKNAQLPRLRGGAGAGGII